MLQPLRTPGQDGLVPSAPVIEAADLLEVDPKRSLSIEPDGSNLPAFLTEEDGADGRVPTTDADSVTAACADDSARTRSRPSNRPSPITWEARRAAPGFLSFRSQIGDLPRNPTELPPHRGRVRAPAAQLAFQPTVALGRGRRATPRSARGPRLTSADRRGDGRREWLCCTDRLGGSVGVKGQGGIGRRPFSDRGCPFALQGEPSRPSSHSAAEVHGHELARL
jgi:hypothetical protein